MSTGLNGECTSHWATTKHRDCLRAMAAGWILHVDLCPHCTRRFMAALDGIEEMPWCEAYRRRADPNAETAVKA